MEKEKSEEVEGERLEREEEKPEELVVVVTVREDFGVESKERCNTLAE